MLTPWALALCLTCLCRSVRIWSIIVCLSQLAFIIGKWFLCFQEVLGQWRGGLLHCSLLRTFSVAVSVPRVKVNRVISITNSVQAFIFLAYQAAINKIRFQTKSDQSRILFRVCNLIPVTILRIPVNKTARFGCLEVFGVVSVMEVLWDESGFMDFQWVGSHDTHQARPDQDIWLCS